MGDLTFAEDLRMLHDGEYTAWVKTTYASIKLATILRGVQFCSKLFNWLLRECLFKSSFVTGKQAEHFEFTKKRVHRRMMQKPNRPDLWTSIIQRDGTAGGLSIKEHYANASMFMLAGTETTATALSGITFYLLRNRASLSLLTKEIRSVFAASDDLNLDELARQRYLNAVIQEGLRMYPLVPSILPRVTPSKGASICGEWIPAGVTVGVHHLATYRSKAFFHKPHEFRPERWLGSPEFINDKLDAMEPFSVGPRNCLGKVGTAFSDRKQVVSLTERLCP